MLHSETCIFNIMVEEKQETRASDKLEIFIAFILLFVADLGKIYWILII